LENPQEVSMQQSSNSFVPSLERGLTILEILAKSRAGLSLSQVTRQLTLPKSSVHCLLRTFEHAGYVYKDTACGKYRVSLSICDLARQALQGISLRDQARQFLRRLSDLTGLTVHMAVLEQGSCVLIEKVTPPGVSRTATWIGKQLALHCTALGKTLLAYLPEADAEQLISDQGLIRYNDNTICSIRQLKQELQLIRLRGYALDDEEEEIGVRCLGAPIFNNNHDAIAALSVVGDASHISEDNLPSLNRDVLEAANRVSEQVRNAQLEAGISLPERIGHLNWRRSSVGQQLQPAGIEADPRLHYADTDGFTEPRMSGSTRIP
jgi:DNA-binding IclR family transcriptional regulator